MAGQERDYDFQRDRILRVETRAEKRADELIGDMRRLEANVVSRNEIASRFDAQDRVMSMVRGEVDEHIRAFNERQQRRIDALDPGYRK